MGTTGHLKNLRDRLFVSTVSYTSPYPSIDPPFDPGPIRKLFTEAWSDPEHFFRIMIESDAFASFKKFLAFLSMIFLVGIIILYPKLVDVTWRLKESRKGGKTKKTIAQPARWSVVLAHMESGTPAEWKLAIMEADNILAGLLRQMGYRGDTLGEMLKGVDQGDFPGINAAWEAHRIRNRIAHEGSHFDLTEREAKRATGLYALALRDLGYL